MIGKARRVSLIAETAKKLDGDSFRRGLSANNRGSGNKKANRSGSGNLSGKKRKVEEER